MNKFMRLIYREISDEINIRRKKRQENFYLSDKTDFIVSLPNQYYHSSIDIGYYHFEYNSSIEYLTYAELILPIHQISIIHIYSSTLIFQLIHLLKKIIIGLKSI